MADEFDGLDESREDGTAAAPLVSAPARIVTKEELAAARAEYRRRARANTGHALPAQAANFDELLALAKQLNRDNTEAAESVVEAGVRMNLTEIQGASIRSAIKNRTKIGLLPLKAQWKQAAERAAAENAPTPAEAAAMEAERQRREQAERDAEREAERGRLEALVAPLAKDPRLLDRMLAAVARSGVVGEERNILAVFLTTLSRLHRRRCVNLLRRGAPASGKNFLVEAVLHLLPKESVIVVSSASAKALAYYGGAGDQDALKHKIVYIPEASSLLGQKGVETEFTGMLRTLISEGRLIYQTVVVRDNEPPITMEIVKNGPIVVIITSARANVEEEFLTRLLFADSDETLGQSSRVMSSLMETACDTPSAPPLTMAEIEGFRNFQRWLELGGPYDVVVPYADSIRAAFTTTPTAIRIRRDLGSMLSAIFASAIAHKAQRGRDAKGRIVARLDDYRHAYAAFEPGLAAIHKPLASPGVIALVRILEPMIERERKRTEAEAAAFLAAHPGEATPFDLQFDGSVKATWAQFLKALGIASKAAIKDRIQQALSEGVIEIVPSGPGKTYGLKYRVLVGSSVLAAAGGVSVFPTPTAVEAMEKDPGKRAAALAAIAAEKAGLASNAPPTAPAQWGTASPAPSNAAGFEDGDEEEEKV